MRGEEEGERRWRAGTRARGDLGAAVRGVDCDLGVLEATGGLGSVKGQI